MSKDRPRKTSVSLRCQVEHGSALEGFRECPGCRVVLELVQPALDQPQCLLGICPRCSAWFIMEDRPESEEFVRIHIPLARLGLGGTTHPDPGASDSLTVPHPDAAPSLPSK